MSFKEGEVQRSNPRIRVQPSLNDNPIDTLSSSSSAKEDSENVSGTKLQVLDVPNALLKRTIFRDKKLKSSNNLESESESSNKQLPPSSSKNRHRHRASIAKFKGVASFENKKLSKWSLLSKRAKQENLKLPEPENSLSPDKKMPRLRSRLSFNCPDNSSSNSSSSQKS